MRILLLGTGLVGVAVQQVTLNTLHHSLLMLLLTIAIDES
jgi:hypothetical protein